MDLKLVMAVHGRIFFFFLNESEKELWFCEMQKQKDRMARESFRALIPCRKPKSNDNGKYKREIEREGENGG